GWIVRDTRADWPDVAPAVVIPGDINATAQSRRNLAIPSPLLRGVGIRDGRRERDRISKLAVGDDGDFSFARRFVSISQIEPAIGVQRAVRIDDMSHPSRTG